MLEIYSNTDGSKTLLNQSLNETYHSRHGAIAESLHVFIEKGLRHYLISEKKEISIFEMGFGTGLNALLSLYHQQQKQRIHYHAVETFPLDYELVQQLNYTMDLPTEISECYEQMHQLPWEQKLVITSNFSLLKQKADLGTLTLVGNSVDLVYFDAFAPDIQPELWCAAIFEMLFTAMRNESVLVTYSSKGDVRRNLIQAGFEVEKLEGPPFKRHMLRALKK
jgi:tRNA U34 5-methylaminomethyl-2-thiouridine-forming methyltransferase MnmC